MTDAEEGRNLEAYFSERFYQRHYSGYSVYRRGALKHYLSEGEQNGYSPNGYFDPKWWSREYGVEKSGNDSIFESYLTNYRNTIPGEDYSLIFNSCFSDEREMADVLAAGGRSRNGLFDFSFLLSQNKTDARAPDPIALFLRLAGEGYNVSPTRFFDSRFYASEYRDVAEAKVNPFVHYIKNGLFENRKPCAFLRCRKNFSEIKNKAHFLSSIRTPSELFELDGRYELDGWDISALGQGSRVFTAVNHFFGEPQLSGIRDFEKMIEVYAAYLEGER